MTAKKKKGGGKDSRDTVVAEGGPAGTDGVLSGHLHARSGGSHEAADGEEAAPHHLL